MKIILAITVVPLMILYALFIVYALTEFIDCHGKSFKEWLKYLVRI